MASPPCCRGCPARRSTTVTGTRLGDGAARPAARHRHVEREGAAGGFGRSVQDDHGQPIAQSAAQAGSREARPPVRRLAIDNVPFDKLEAGRGQFRQPLAAGLKFLAIVGGRGPRSCRVGQIGALDRRTRSIRRTGGALARAATHDAGNRRRLDRLATGHARTSGSDRASAKGRRGAARPGSRHRR